jgi:hypothetical protein
MSYSSASLTNLDDGKLINSDQDLASWPGIFHTLPPATFLPMMWAWLTSSLLKSPCPVMSQYHAVSCRYDDREDVDGRPLTVQVDDARLSSERTFRA